MIDLQKHEGLHLNRALCYKNIGEMDKAEKDIDVSLKINPDFERAKLEKQLLKQ